MKQYYLLQARKNVISIIASSVWAFFNVIIGILEDINEREEIGFLQAILMISAFTGLFLAIGVIHLVYTAKTKKLLYLSSVSLPQNEEGRLRRVLINCKLRRDKIIAIDTAIAFLLIDCFLGVFLLLHLSFLWFILPVAVAIAVSIFALIQWAKINGEWQECVNSLCNYLHISLKDPLAEGEDKNFG